MFFLDRVHLLTERMDLRFEFLVTGILCLAPYRACCQNEEESRYTKGVQKSIFHIS